MARVRTGGILALAVAALVGGGLLLGSLGREPRARVQVAAAPEDVREPPAALLEEWSARPPASALANAPPRREEAPEVPGAGAEDSGSGGTAWLELRIVAKESQLPLAGVRAEPAYWGEAREAPGARRVGPSGSRSSGQDGPRSDGDGRVALEVRARRGFTLVLDALPAVHARGTSRSVPPLAAGGRFALQVELETRNDLRWFARVLDDATGAPLGGALAAWSEGDRRLTTVSAADGVLAIDFASWGETRVAIELAGYLTERVLLERGHESPEGAFPVRLVQPATLEVRVHDGAGAPLAGIPVDVARLEPFGSDGPTELPASLGFDDRRSTDRSGACTFESLPAREKLAVVVRPGLGRSQREVVTLVPGATRALAFEVASGCTVQGLAVDERGQPLAKLDLWRFAAAQASAYIEPASESAVVAKARTDARGRFAFQNVPAGEWWIGPAPYHRNLGIVPLATRVGIPPGESVLQVTIVCPAPRSIRGRVLDPEGEPAQASVTASREGVSFSAQSGGDGRFIVGQLSEGDWLLQARALGGRVAPSEEVRAAGGAGEVVLRLRAGGGVGGVVLDARGAPVPGAEVALVPGEPGARETCFSWLDGSFAFERTPPGVYHLRAKSGAMAGVLGPLALGPGQTHERLELVLSLGADLRVRLASGAPVLFEVRVLTSGGPLAGEGLAPGAEWIETLPPGPVLVQLARRTGAHELQVVEEQRIGLRAGETALVEFTGREGPLSGAR